MLTKGFIAAAIASALIATLLLIDNVSIAGASATSNGIIHFYSDQSNDITGATGPIVITGVIGDYGTATSIDKNGTVNVNGNYEKVVLKKGTFIINSVALDKSTSNAQPTINSSNCSVSESASGSVSLFDGTGAYAGIKGTLSVEVTFAGIIPTSKNGKCNGNAQPLGVFGTITGSGPVTF